MTSRSVVVDPEDFDLMSQYRWRINADGYAVATVPTGKRGGRKIFLHHIVLARKLGRPIASGMLTDHRDRNRLNNRRENLREATPSENARNKSASRVVQNDRSRYWRVYCTFDGRTRTINSIPSKAEADRIAAVVDQCVRDGDSLKDLFAELKRPRGPRLDCASGIRHVSRREGGFRARVTTRGGKNHWGPLRQSAAEAANDAEQIRLLVAAP